MIYTNNDRFFENYIVKLSSKLVEKTIKINTLGYNGERDGRNK